MKKKLTGDKRKRIIEKIQLLFNRAERSVTDATDVESVDHEAQLALETARKLMLTYGLEAHDVETVSVGKAVEGMGGGYVVNLGISKTSEWVKTLAVTIADYFCVKVLYTPENTNGVKSSFLYYGIEVGAQGAAYAFESCFNQIRILSRRYKVDRNKWEKHPAQFVFRTWEIYRECAKEEYRKGLVIGFYERLLKIKKNESKEETALAICYTTVADEWVKGKPFAISKEVPTKADKPYTADGHYTRGYKDSDKVAMVHGMCGKVDSDANK